MSSLRRGHHILVVAVACSISIVAVASAQDPEPAPSEAAPASTGGAPAATAATTAAGTTPAPTSASPSAGDAPAEASPQAMMYAKKCGSCHALGDGDRTGPDLLGTTNRRSRTWLTTFIRNPGNAIDSGDPVANELLTKFKGVRMPDQTLTDAELDALLAYIEDCTAKKGCKLAFGKVKPARDATPADIDAGRALFEGRTPLANGGVACIACHNVHGAGIVGGGTLAKDLTHAYARLGEQGTTAALATTPFLLMKNLYETQPLTDAEAFKLKAYLYASSRDGAIPPTDYNFFYLGVLGAVASFGAIGAGWRNRLRGVRKHIIERGKR